MKVYGFNYFLFCFEFINDDFKFSAIKWHATHCSMESLFHFLLLNHFDVDQTDI